MCVNIFNNLKINDYILINLLVVRVFDSLLVMYID